MSGSARGSDKSSLTRWIAVALVLSGWLSAARLPSSRVDLDNESLKHISTTQAFDRYLVSCIFCSDREVYCCDGSRSSWQVVFIYPAVLR